MKSVVFKYVCTIAVPLIADGNIRHFRPNTTEGLGASGRTQPVPGWPRRFPTGVGYDQ